MQYPQYLHSFSFDPECLICEQNKAHRAYCRSVTAPRVDANPAPTRFGEAITADHKILNKLDESRDHDRAALIVQDKATYWLQGHPAASKNGKETKKAFNSFLDWDAKMSMSILIAVKK